MKNYEEYANSKISELNNLIGKEKKARELFNFINQTNNKDENYFKKLLDLSYIYEELEDYSKCYDILKNNYEILKNNKEKG